MKRKRWLRGLLSLWLVLVTAGVMVVWPTGGPVAAEASVVVSDTTDLFNVPGKVCGNVTPADLPGPRGTISLREALCASTLDSGHTTITFSVLGTITLTSDLPPGLNNLTINGPGAGVLKITQPGGIIFNGVAINFTIRGVTLGNSTTAIRTSFSTDMTVDNCVLSNNANGILVDGGKITLTNSLLQYNDYGLNTGLSPGEMVVDNSTITQGIGLQLDQGTKATVTNSTLRLGSYGVLVSGTSKLTLNNSLITGRSSAIRLFSGGQATINNSQLSLNSDTGIRFSNGGQATVNGSTISGNGWGVVLDHGGNAVIDTSLIQGNSNHGIYIDGSGATTVTRTTIANNLHEGIYFNYGGSTILTNSTLIANGGYGVLFVNGGTALLTNATVAYNINGLGYVGNGGGSSIVNSIFSHPGGANCTSGSPSSGGHNLVDDGSCGLQDGHNGDKVVASGTTGLDPMGQENHGGPTPTVALLPGSPAIDGGDNGICAQTGAGKVNGVDQRGTVRPQGALCDSGAYEWSASPSPSPSPSPAPSPGACPASGAGDVPANFWAYCSIGTLTQRGITNGCTTTAYCPDALVTRAQMAVFISKALGYTSPQTPNAPRFSDVDPGHWAYSYIDLFATLGITNGCTTTSYCPDAPVTRAQMAKFLARAKGQVERSPNTPSFTDVPSDYWAYGWIEQFKTLGITQGCRKEGRVSAYCPDEPVTRAQMAVFIIRAWP